MPITNIIQPEFIQINENLRLHKFDNVFDFALEWYQDEETLILLDGEYIPYTPERLAKMYTYLNERGELYFIEVRKSGEYVPIGDVTFWQNDMPIIIGVPEYRRKGIGKKVVNALIQRGKQLGYKELFVAEIYDHNIGSQKCFMSAGFTPCEKTEQGSRYRLSVEGQQ